MRVRPQHSALLLVLVLPIAAQQGAAIFHHFRHYPTGQYTTQYERSGYGLSPSAPLTQTVCTVTPNPAQVAEATRMANSASMQNCTTRVLRDEEKIAESEKTCHNGPSTQVMHMTITAIDDKTFKTDTVSKTGTLEVFLHSTVHYDGPCTAAQLAEASQAATRKPDPKECAEFAASQKELADSPMSCDQVPAEYRAACTKNLQAAAANVKQIMEACAK